MEYTIARSEDGAYIIVKTIGAVTRNEAVQQTLEAHELGRRLGIDRYLVDVTEATNVDPTVETYEFAYTDMQTTQGIDRNATVAVLTRPNDRSHDFVGVVATNTGLNVKIFTDRADAVRFLLADDEGPSQ